MTRGGLRGRSFHETQKKSSSGGLTALLLLLLLGSLGFSVYIYQDNAKIKENQYLIETLEYGYGLLDKEKTVLEKENRDLEEKNKELERELHILVDINNKPLTADDGQVQDQKELNEITLLLNSLKKDKDELNAKAAALEKIINSKNSEILDLQVQLARSSDQFVVLSNEVDDLIVDGDYLPIVKVAPIYPRRAQTRGLEGYCLLEFTVTRTGTVRDARAIECTSSLFQRASVNAAGKFKYKPRVVDGQEIEVPGVRHIFRFELED